jgi:hypothetical protein
MSATGCQIVPRDCQIPVRFNLRGTASRSLTLPGSERDARPAVTGRTSPLGVECARGRRRTGAGDQESRGPRTSYG